MRRDCRICVHYEHEEPEVYIINGVREYLHCFWCRYLKSEFHFYSPCNSFERKQVRRL